MLSALVSPNYLHSCIFNCHSQGHYELVANQCHDWLLSLEIFWIPNLVQMQALRYSNFFFEAFLCFVLGYLVFATFPKLRRTYKFELNGHLTDASCITFHASSCWEEPTNLSITSAVNMRIMSHSRPYKQSEPKKDQKWQKRTIIITKDGLGHRKYRWSVPKDTFSQDSRAKRGLSSRYLQYLALRWLHLYLFGLWIYQFILRHVTQTLRNSL